MSSYRNRWNSVSDKLYVFRLQDLLRDISRMSASDAVDAIRQRGCEDFLDSRGIGLRKLDLLVNLTSRETTIDALINRLEHLERRVAELMDDERERVTGGIVVSSVRSAKGLEFDTVIVCDAVEGTFPSLRDTDDIDTFAEEHRIFFVAMTRARDHLVLMRRLDWGSSLIEEVEGYLEVTLT